MYESHSCSWLYNAVLLYRKELLSSLNNVFCVRARNVYENRGKVLTELRANGRNIVGCYMLRPFAYPVACCWELLGKKLETSQTFSYVQTDATTPNIVGSSLT